MATGLAIRFMWQAEQPAPAEALKTLRERAGLTMAELARALGYKGASSYQRYENADLFTKKYIPLELAEKLVGAISGKGDPPITEAEIMQLAGQEQPDKLARTVPVVGYVGAGSAMHHYAFADSPNDFVPMPENGNKNTVAVEIRGSSLGSIFDTWLVYYDHVHTPPTADMLNKLCVIGLPDDRVLVKRLRRGSSNGLYNLESTTEGLIEDVAVVWAAKVKNMSPR